MEIPKKIKHAIYMSAKYNAMARSHEKDIDKWLEKLGRVEDDGIRDIIIDLVHQSEQPDRAIAALEIELA